jgi:hypothetical protein
MGALRDQLLVPAVAVVVLVGVGACGISLVHPDAADAHRFDAASAVAGHFIALCCVALQMLAGYSLLSRLGWSGALRGWVDQALFSWLAGFVVTTAVAMSLVAVGALNGWSVGLGALGLVALSRPAVAAAWRALGASRRSFRWPPGRSELTALGLGIALVAVAAAWLWPLWLQTLLPNSDWDSAAYHLPMAQRYLEGELWNRDPLFHAYSFPGGVSLLYAVVSAIGFESAVIPLNWLAALLTLVGVYGLARDLGGGPRAGIWAGLAYASTHIFWQLAIDPRVDGFLALFTFLVFYALAGWLRSSDERWLLLLALAANAALGVKYIGLVFAGGLVVIALGSALLAQVRGRVRLRPRFLAAFGLCLLVPNGGWYAANAVFHHDPIYPFLSGGGGYYRNAAGARARLADTLEPHLAGLASDHAMERTRIEFEQVATRYSERTLLNPYRLLTRPDDYSVKSNHFVSPLLLISLALPLCVGLGARERRAALVVFGSALAFYLAFGSQTDLIRYVVPLLSVFAVGTGVVLGAFRSPVWNVAWAAVGVWILLGNLQAEQAKLSSLQTERYFAGSLDRIGWLAQVGYNFTPAMPLMIEYVNRQIAAGAMRESDRLLMVGEAKGRLLRCRYVPDSSWQLDRWLVELLNVDLDYPRLAQHLREQGITHVLYNRGYFRWVLENTRIPRERLAFGLVHLERFLERHATPLHTRDGITLVRLESPPGETGEER